MEIDAVKERDKVFERDGARLIVDKKSFLYLNGSQLDSSVWGVGTWRRGAYAASRSAPSADSRHASARPASVSCAPSRHISSPRGGGCDGRRFRVAGERRRSRQEKQLCL